MRAARRRVSTFDPEFIENGKKRRIKGYATDITTDLALRFLDTVRDEPFLLVYQHKAPHRPFTPRRATPICSTTSNSRIRATFDDDYATRKLAKEAQDMRLDISLAPDYKDEMPKNLSAGRAQAVDLPAIREGPLSRDVRRG